MYTLETLKQTKIALQFTDKQCINVNSDDTDENHTIFYSIHLPCCSCYPWNDFDRHFLYLVIKEISVEKLAKYSETVSKKMTDTNSTLPSCVSPISNAIPSMDFFLLAFIRYLQLINFIRWSSPIPIVDGSTSASTHNTMNGTSKKASKSTKQNKSFKKTPFEPGLCGLTNIGNTCFMNSAIQCLSNIPQLTEWAMKQKISEQIKTVTQAYASLIQSMWSGDNFCVTPSTIKQRVSRYAPIFTDFAQKDSHEFMNSLLNAIHAELTENNSSEEQSSIITNLFRIRTESGVTCSNCEVYDATEEITYCLPLPLGDEEKVSLDVLVNDFTKEEELDGQYYCSSCQNLQSAKQRTSISGPLPPVIIIQLKRFSFDNTYDKLETFVDYPIVDWKVLADDDSMYDLIGVSMHVGNLRRGHYTTYARLNGSGQWYHFNDSFCKPVGHNDHLISRDAYILIYLKKN